MEHKIIDHLTSHADGIDRFALVAFLCSLSKSELFKEYNKSVVNYYNDECKRFDLGGCQMDIYKKSSYKFYQWNKPGKGTYQATARQHSKKIIASELQDYYYPTITDQGWVWECEANEPIDCQWERAYLEGC